MLQINSVSKNSNTNYNTTISGAFVSVSYNYRNAAPASVQVNANKQIGSTSLNLFKDMSTSSTFTDEEKELWGESFCSTVMLLVAATIENYTDPDSIKVEEVVVDETATSQTA